MGNISTVIQAGDIIASNFKRSWKTLWLIPKPQRLERVLGGNYSIPTAIPIKQVKPRNDEVPYQLVSRQRILQEIFQGRARLEKPNKDLSTKEHNLQVLWDSPLFWGLIELGTPIFINVDENGSIENLTKEKQDNSACELNLIDTEIVPTILDAKRMPVGYYEILGPINFALGNTKIKLNNAMK